MGHSTLHMDMHIHCGWTVRKESTLTVRTQTTETIHQTTEVVHDTQPIKNILQVDIERREACNPNEEMIVSASGSEELHAQASSPPEPHAQASTPREPEKTTDGERASRRDLLDLHQQMLSVPRHERRALQQRAEELELTMWGSRSAPDSEGHDTEGVCREARTVAVRTSGRKCQCASSADVTWMMQRAWSICRVVMGFTLRASLNGGSIRMGMGDAQYAGKRMGRCGRKPQHYLKTMWKTITVYTKICSIPCLRQWLTTAGLSLLSDLLITGVLSQPDARPVVDSAGGQASFGKAMFTASAMGVIVTGKMSAHVAHWLALARAGSAEGPGSANGATPMPCASSAAGPVSSGELR